MVAFIFVSTGWSVNTATVELCNSRKQRPRIVLLRQSAGYIKLLVDNDIRWRASPGNRMVSVFPFGCFLVVHSLVLPCGFPSEVFPPGFVYSVTPVSDSCEANIFHGTNLIHNKMTIQLQRKVNSVSEHRKSRSIMDQCYVIKF